MQGLRVTRRTEIGLWLFVGLVSLGISIVTYKHAHSEAALHLKIDRDEALVKAGEFLRSQGYDLSQHRNTIIFSEDHYAKQFLEKQLGQAEANALMAGDVSTWYWVTRFFVPQQLEEYWVLLGPDGRLVNFFHQVKETDPGATLTVEAAEAIATTFLQERKHLDLAQYEIIERSQKERPNRLDRSFTWKRKNFDRAGATYRLNVTVYGDRIGNYREYLDVPETWQKEQQREDARRSALMALAMSGSVIFLIQALILLIRNLRNPLFRYGFGLQLALLIFATNMLVFLNEYTIMWLGYDTTQPASVFVLEQFVEALIKALPFTVIVLLMAYAASYVARRAFPEHIPFSHMFTGVFWRSKPVILAVFVGICLAFFHVAFNNLFYIIGRSVGVWCPLETPYTTAVALPMPWLMPFEIGFLAAVQEETVYRLFAVSALLLLIKRRWIAILIPALLWGFMHSNYPQEPIFIRGLEVGLIGIVYGYVFVQYGIVATMVSHFTYNALAGGDFFLRSGNAYLIFCALIVLIIPYIPLVASGVLRLRGKSLTSFDDVVEKPLREWAPQFPSGPVSWNAPEHYSAYKPLSKWILAICGMGACVGLAVYLLGTPGERFGGYIHVTVDRLEAQQRADAYLQLLGVEINRYRRLTWFDADLSGHEADYCFQKNGLKELNRFFKANFTDRGAWSTWYFQPGDQEQYWVSVTPDGRVIDYHHTIAEAVPGAKLSEQAAREIAENRLRQQGYAVERYTMANVENIERPNRLDHVFTFEDKENAVDEARLRKRVLVQGDQVGGIWTFLKLPETWEREHDKHYWWEIAAGICFALVLLVYLIRWALLFNVFLKFNLLSFRPYTPFVLAGVICFYLDLINTPGEPWASYNVAEELVAFWTRKILFAFCLGGGGLIMGVMLCGFIGATYHFVFPACRPLTCWFKSKTGDALPLRLVWGEALLLACLFSIILVSLGQLFSAGLSESNADSFFASVRDTAPMPIAFDILQVRLPALHAITWAFLGGISSLFAGMFKASLYKLYWSGPKRLVAVSIGIGIVVACSEAENMRQGIVIAVGSAFLISGMVGLAVLMVRHVFRDNLPAYLMTFILPYIFHEGLRLVVMPNTFYRMNGLILLACFGLCGLVGLGLYLSGIRNRIMVPESGIEEENIRPVVE